jgi:hypothetical protein
MSALDSEIHGGLLVNILNLDRMEPITFPFDDSVPTNGVNTKRGNQIKEYDPTTVNPFDYWHSSRNASKQNIFVVERGITVEGRMVGHEADRVLRHTLHHVVTMNEGTRREERQDMLEQVTSAVMPNLSSPAMISMEMQSSQPKFLLISREIPIYINVFCDEACMLLVWSNEKQIESRMREHYGNRFVVYRMPPIVNSVCVVQTYFLRKRIKRWRNEMRGDNLRLLNALEGFIFRRAKQDDRE